MNAELAKLENARRLAIERGERAGRVSGTLLRFATAYDGIEGMDIDGKAFLFPVWKVDEPEFTLFFMQEMITRMSEDELATRLLEIVEESICNGDLPTNPLEFTPEKSV